MTEIVIPFAGFYNSLHDGEIDCALEQMLSDESGSAYSGLVARFYDRANFRSVHEDYAKAYAEAFADEFKIKLEFKALVSPREYNFTTDRIFCEIDAVEVQRLFDGTCPNELTRVAEEMFTSRDGFSSYYSPDWRSWGPPDTWDHNQLACLLQAWMVGLEFDEYAEINLMEDYRCNGHLDSALYNCNPDSERLCRVRDYLNQRELR